MKSHLFILSFVATLFALSAVASACGGGDDELKQAGGDDELKQALESLWENDLAFMGLPQDKLGDEFADLEVEASGFQDNRARADYTIDPEDTADDLEEAGRINGFVLAYADPALSALDAQDAGEGLAGVSTEIDLFKDGDRASDFLAKQIDDFQRLEGEEVDGIVLEEVETFAVDGLADEATGLRLQFSSDDVQGYVTFVAFRLGRLVGTATLSRADDADVNSQAEEIARALEQRIEGVLLGEITGTPVAIPEAVDVFEEATVTPPAGIPDLASMALSLDDLPADVFIGREGYVEDEDTVASYEREFYQGPRALPPDTLPGHSLESDIDLYDSAAEAAVATRKLEAVWMSESAEELVASGFDEAGGYEPTNVQSKSLLLYDMGDKSLAVRVSFDTPEGSYDSVLVLVRTGEVVGTLIVTGLAGRVGVTDVVPLAEAMTERMEAN